MLKESRQFLENLLATASPSGFEAPIQRIIRDRMAPIADQVEVDIHGNLAAVYNPDAKIRVMLAGHCDQIGFMVTHIDDRGFIYIKAIGGIDASVLPGTALTILGREGHIPAIIGHKPVHLVPAADRGKKVKIEDVWVDIGVESGKEAKKLVQPGDPVSFELKLRELGKTKISSAACDDKVGAFVVMEALRILSERLTPAQKKKFPVALYAVSTVQEEIGLRGARTSCYGIDPIVGIAVDVTHASDNPGATAKKVGTVELGKGPTIARGANINLALEELLISTAKKKRIDYQPLAAPTATGTDANAIQITKAGVAAALIGIPNRYMHTQVEVVDTRDLESAAMLIAETVMNIDEKSDFIPI